MLERRPRESDRAVHDISAVSPGKQNQTDKSSPETQYESSDAENSQTEGQIGQIEIERNRETETKTIVSLRVSARRKSVCSQLWRNIFLSVRLFPCLSVCLSLGSCL